MAASDLVFNILKLRIPPIWTWRRLSAAISARVAVRCIRDEPDIRLQPHHFRRIDVDADASVQAGIQRHRRY